VTVAEVTAAARRTLVFSRSTALVALPAVGEPVDDALWAEALAEKLRPVTTALPAEAHGVVEVVPGVRVLVLPRPGTGVVAAHAHVPGGPAVESVDRPGLAQVAARALAGADGVRGLVGPEHLALEAARRPRRRV